MRVGLAHTHEGLGDTRRRLCSVDDEVICLHDINEDLAHSTDKAVHDPGLETEVVLGSDPAPT